MFQGRIDGHIYITHRSLDIMSVLIRAGKRERGIV